MLICENLHPFDIRSSMATATHLEHESPIWDAENVDIPTITDVEETTVRTMDLSYHGSCPKCHHLHTNKRWTVSTDPKIHTRVACDECTHPMGGIGRASTQTTLASIESIPVRLNRNSDTFRPTTLITCVNAPPTLNISSPRIPELTPIIEANTLAGRSRSTSNLPVPEPNLQGQDNNRNQTSVTPPRSLRYKRPLSQVQSTEREQPQPRARFQFRTFFGRGKKRLLGKAKGLRVLGYHIRITRDKQITCESPRPEDLTPTAMEQMSPSNPPEVMVDACHTLEEPPSLPRISSGSPSPAAFVADLPDLNRPPDDSHGESLSRNAPEHEIEIPNAAGNPRDLEDVDSDRRAQVKKSRITARRREATLKQRRPFCHCSPGCACLGNNAGDSDLTSEAQDLPSSILTRDVPDAPVQGPWTAGSSRGVGSYASQVVRNIVGIGTHVNSAPIYATRRISIADYSSSGTESSRRRANRLSQDTTTWGSNNSSVSLITRLPSPGPGLAMFGPNHRYGGRILAQTFDVPLQHQDSTVETRAMASRPGVGSGHVLPISYLNDANQRPLSRENMHDPEVENPTSQHSSNRDATVSSRTTLMNETQNLSESQERTPRPHSYNATAADATSLTPAADVLLLALQELVPPQGDE